jgi:hypothetical protein
MRDEIKERKNIQSIPSYLSLNKYIHEISKNKKSNDNIVVYENDVVERKPLPLHLGNTIDIYV